MHAGHFASHRLGPAYAARAACTVGRTAWSAKRLRQFRSRHVDPAPHPTGETRIAPMVRPRGTVGPAMLVAPPPSDVGNGGLTPEKRDLPNPECEQAAKKERVAMEWDGKLPPPDSPQDARPTMDHVMREVCLELPQALQSAIGTANSHTVSRFLWEVSPLSIKKTLQDGELSTFKAPWTSEQASASIQTTGLYEAGCNIFWIDARGTHAMPFDLPITRPSWACVHEVFERCFGTSASALGGVTLAASNRLYFPVTLPVFVVDEQVLKSKSLNSNLHLVGGHALVYAWYLAAWHALKTQDFPYLLRVWECGLTVSVRVRLVSASDPRAVLLDSWSFSEAVQVAKLSGSDSFVVFAAKLASFAQLQKAAAPGGKANQDSIVKRLASQGVRYKGAPLNGTMFKMANAVHAGLTAKALMRVDILEWKYGPDLLSTSYNKLGRLVQTCQKAVPSLGHSLVYGGPDELVTFVLDMIDFSVQSRLVSSAKFFIVEVCDKQKDGSQGWFGLTVNKFKVCTFLQSQFLENLRRGNEVLCKVLESDVVPLFRTCDTVLQNFFLAKDGATDEGGDAVSSTLSPVAKQFRDLLLQIFQGAFDVCFKSASLESSARDMVTAPADDAPSKLQEMYSSLQRGAATLAAVSSHSNEAPRNLKREDSVVSVEEDDQALRQSVLKKAESERMNYVQFMTVRDLTKANLDSAYLKSGVRSMATSKDNNRAFVCCADLLREHNSEPWARAQGPSEKDLEAITSWMKEMKGAHDWLFLFDGRNRETLMQLHKCMQGRPHIYELLLLFSGCARMEIGRTRKVALGASNIETVLLSPPAARTALSAKPRTSFNALGEQSTHDTTYSGVPYRPRTCLPRITERDKKEIMGMESPAHVPEALMQHFPNPVLFWQEAKPVEIYEQLMIDFDIKSVFDTSPGSGAMAEAALKLGVTYVGVTTSQTHTKWLNNALDRVALGHITTPGRPCYDKEFAVDVQKYCADILIALEDSEEAEEGDPIEAFFSK